MGDLARVQRHPYREAKIKAGEAALEDVFVTYGKKLKELQLRLIKAGKLDAVVEGKQEITRIAAELATIREGEIARDNIESVEQIITIPAEADGYVKAGKSGTNFGNGTSPPDERRQQQQHAVGVSAVRPEIILESMIPRRLDRL